MNKKATLGELIYVISAYEKSRIRVRLIWGKKYVTSLYSSLSILKYLISMLQRKQSITTTEMLPVFEFINKNVNIIFSNKIEMELSEGVDASNILLHYEDSTDDNEDDIIILMYNTINECLTLLNSKERKYKNKIVYLLMALHNLPKVFTDNSQSTLFNIFIAPISKQDAIECYYSYIRRKSQIDKT